MKRIIASAGFVALGVASLHAANDMGFTAFEKTKPWSISAALRGFYDDNYLTRDKAFARDSYGFELTPTAKFNYIQDQTQIALSYTYSMRYYEDRTQNSADHSHQAMISLDHQFTERYKLSLKDAFVVAQEPQLIDPSGVVAFPLRANGNNIRNTGSIDFIADVTPELGLGVGYANNFYDYEQRGPGSYSALLDRDEHLAHLDLRYKVMEGTYALVGYAYGLVQHSSKDDLADPLTRALFPAAPSNPNVRDTESHYVYAGVDHRFSPQFTANAKVGAQFVDYTKLPGGNDTVSPYADASVNWTYNPGSYVQVGVKHQRNQTDIAYTGTGSPTADQESTSVYVNVTHQITAKLTGNLLAQYQNSSFRGGAVNGFTDNIYLIGVMASYQINQFLSAEAGYNYDKLDSQIAFRGFDRNRVFIGVRATY